MSQTQTVGRTHTTVSRDGGRLRVTYHWTDVVSVADDGEITLNTGGWRTVTTKLRMNQAANQFGLGFGVCQRDFEWFVIFKNPKYTSYGAEPYWLPYELPFDGHSITFNPKTVMEEIQNVSIF